MRATSREVPKKGPLNDCTPDFLPEGRKMIQSELAGDCKRGNPHPEGRMLIMRSRKIEDYKKNLKLTSEQREILVGVLLGDAHLETQNRGRTYRVKFEQSEKHKEYLWHLYEVFKNWVLSPPQKKVVKIENKTYVKWWFHTVSHGSFRFYAHQFYREGRKSVPRLIHRWLTPRALAYWFADDGSRKSKDSYAVIFNTQGYEKFEVERLAKVLKEKFQLKVSLRKQKEGWQIYIHGESFPHFKELVEPYLHPSMRYKLVPPSSG